MEQSPCFLSVAAHSVRIILILLPVTCVCPAKEEVVWFDMFGFGISSFLFWCGFETRKYIPISPLSLFSFSPAPGRQSRHQRKDNRNQQRALQIKKTIVSRPRQPHKTKSWNQPASEANPILKLMFISLQNKSYLRFIFVVNRNPKLPCWTHSFP